MDKAIEPDKPQAPWSEPAGGLVALSEVAQELGQADGLRGLDLLAKYGLVPARRHLLNVERGARTEWCLARSHRDDLLRWQYHATAALGVDALRQMDAVAWLKTLREHGATGAG